MADELTGPASQSSALKPTLRMGVIRLYVIVVGAQGPHHSDNVAHSSARPGGTEIPNSPVPRRPCSVTHYRSASCRPLSPLGRAARARQSKTVQ
ncbi:hypothetical protein ElyMa_000590800 [Elysia marginata]|uniref:Uncharacterized protein n=1 Tax=Elysia marginata TaxID=1093978 RepID=A0AAV4G7B1_9GAST|nr:hypothetical protein ElyMa_000590800 [Elysia marginata]